MLNKNEQLDLSKIELEYYALSAKYNNLIYTIKTYVIGVLTFLISLTLLFVFF